MAQIQLAPITGFNISTLQTSVNYTPFGLHFRYRNGFVGGLNMKYDFKNKFNLQLEGTFSQRGAEYTGDQLFLPIKHRINFIEFSTLGEYNLNNIYALNAGISFGINTEEDFNNDNIAITDGTGSNDLNIIGGLKFYIGSFFVRTTYHHGLKAIQGIELTDNNGQTTGIKDQYNQSFQFSIGYYFL